MTEVTKDFIKEFKSRSELHNGDDCKVEVRKGIVDRYNYGRDILDDNHDDMKENENRQSFKSSGE